MVQNRTV